MRQIISSVKMIGEGKIIELRGWCVDQAGKLPLRVDRLVQKVSAELRKGKIGLAGNHVISQLANLLFIGFMANLRSTDHNHQTRLDTFQVRNQPGRDHDIPDINTEADDPRVISQDLLGDIAGPLVDLKLHQPGPGFERAKVRCQVAQAERRMCVTRVAGGEDDVCPRRSLPPVIRLVNHCVCSS